MAYKFQFGQAILSGALDQEGDIDILDSGELKMAGTTTIANNRNATLAGVTATTLGHVDDLDLMTLADTSITIATDAALTYKGTAITSTGAELNLVDGSSAGSVVNNKAVIYNGSGVVIGQSLATADDGNIGNVTNNDLITLAAAEVTIKSNSDFTVAKAGGFKLSDGAVTSTAAELNLVDGSSAGSIVNSKAVIYSALGAVTASALSSSGGLAIAGGLRMESGNPLGVEVITKAGAATFTAMDADNIKIDGNVISSTNADGNIELSPAGIGEVLIGAANLNYAGDAVTSTGAELNLLDGSGAGSIVNSKAVIYSATGAVTASALSSSGNITSNGEIIMQGNATVRGQIVNLPGVAAAAVAAADLFVARDNASGDLKVRTRTNVASDFAGSAATTALKAASGVISLDIDNLGAEALGTGDTIVFNDDGDNGLHKITFDNVITKAPALLTAGAIAVADDHFMFLDGGATGDAKSESIVDLVAGMAGAGLSAANGQLSTQAGSVTAATEGSFLAEGYNFTTGTLGANLLKLPVNASTGDVVVIKSGDLAAGKSVLVSASHPQTIDGAKTLLLESPYAAVTCVLLASASWGIV